MYYITLSQGAAHEVYLHGSDSKSVMENWEGRDKSLVKNKSIVKTFCRTEVRVYALLCKLHDHDFVRRISFIRPSWPGGAVAKLRPARRGPRQVAAPSPGQDVTTFLHVHTAPTPVGKVTTLLHVRTTPTPVGKGTPRIPHTPGRKLGALWFHNQV